MINQSDLMRNLLLRAPTDDSWNQTAKPQVMPDWSNANTHDFLIGRDTDFVNMPRIGLRPTFPFPGQMIETGCGCGIQPDQQGLEQQRAIVRLVNVLINMAQNLINRLANFAGMNPPNYQLQGLDGAPSMTDQLGIPMNPNMIDPGFNLMNPGLMIDPSQIKQLPLIIPTPKEENKGSRLGNLFEGLQSGWSSLKEIVTSGKDLWKTVREGWGSFKDFAKPLLGGFGSILSSPLRNIGSIFKNGFNFIKNLF